MPAPAAASPRVPSRVSSRPLILVLALAVVAAAVAVPAASLVVAAETPDHLVFSEVVTGGVSASDELVEIYNPTATALPLEGLELVYVSATGGTVTRRVTWAAGAPLVPAREHVLAANDLGVFASIADVLYTGGMAATGGSVALRIQGAATAIDAVGWGSAASSWMEGLPASAPGAGESIERLPGGADGSGVDTDANAADFVVRSVPDPQNLGSDPTPGEVAPTPSPVVPPPPDPTPHPTPATTPDPSPVATPDPTPPTTPPPGPSVLSVAAARGMPDGTIVTVEGISLTGSDFTDGGGYLVDATGGVAVLPDGDVFARGRSLRVTGEVDDRFGQRTLRVAAAGIVDIGPGADPAAAGVATGAVGEAVEGTLVRIAATILGPASGLTSGVAFDIDDGSGATRLVVGTDTGIDVAGWGTGTGLELVGVVGQRDSTGTGTVGYRVQPRDGADVIGVHAPASPTPTPTDDASAAPDPSATPEPDVMSISAARSAPRNARVRVRGTVTLPTGIVDAQTAVIQDGTGAIVLRLSEEAGALGLGQRVDVTGARSTKSGMETIRVTAAPGQLGTAAEPGPVTVATGVAGEAHEAALVLVRGGLVASARRSSSGTVSMEIDDGSGPLRVVVGASLELDHSLLGAGTWIEVRGILGQETTGAQPLRGYRVWPRSAGDVRITAAATDAGAGADRGEDGTGASGTASDVGDLGDLRASADADAVVGATLVVGSWPELGIAGVLWDGERLVGLASDDATRVAGALGSSRPPVSLEFRGLRGNGTARHGFPLVAIGEGGAVATRSAGQIAAPTTRWPQPGDAARWFAVVGRLEGPPHDPRVRTVDGTVAIDLRCGADEAAPRGVVTVLGIAVAARDALIVPCAGIVAGSQVERAVVAPAPARLTGDVGGQDAAAAAAPDTTAGAVAAGLLGLSALVLVGMAAWIRWRPVEPDPRPTVGATPEVAEDGALDAPTPSQPILTLVTLPRDRSP